MTLPGEGLRPAPLGLLTPPQCQLRKLVFHFFFFFISLSIIGRIGRDTSQRRSGLSERGSILKNKTKKKTITIRNTNTKIIKTKRKNNPPIGQTKIKI